MFLTDEIISALIDKQIALEGRFFVIGGNARLETAVGGLDVAVAVVDADDDGIGVVHKIHRVSFLPHSGDTKIMMILSEKSNFETFHVLVIVLVSGQNVHSPQATYLLSHKWTKCPLAVKRV